METIKRILETRNVRNPLEDMEVGERYEIPSDRTAADMDLTIEKVRPDEIDVAHYYTQRSDLMREPEIVYKIDEDGSWTPVEYRRDPGIYQLDRSGLPGVEDFAETWDRKPRKRGILASLKPSIGDRFRQFC